MIVFLEGIVVAVANARLYLLTLKRESKPEVEH
jgi:hypothetical protein